MTFDTPFPPSFEGNPYSYGFALFGLTLICALSIAMLLQFWFDARIRTEACKMAVNPQPLRVGWSTPLAIHRLITAGFLTTILSGALPDVLVLYFWGEAGRTTMEILFAIDRIGDGFTIVPFGVATILSAWGIQAIPQALIREEKVKLKPIKWEVWKDKLKIAVAVLVLAIGVTIAKATA